MHNTPDPSHVPRWQDLFPQGCEPPAGFRVVWQADKVHPRSPCLTWGFPEPGPQTLNRLVWWPQGVCRRLRVGVCSSHVGDRRDLSPWWYDLLRTAVLRIDRSTEVLLAVSGTAVHDSLTVATRLFEVPLLTVRVEHKNGPAGENLSHWWRDISQTTPGEDHRADSCWTAVVSPLVPTDGVHDSAEPFRDKDIPARDQISLTSVVRCYILACRRKGNIHRLLKVLNAEPEQQRPMLLLAASAGTTPDLFEELTNNGTIPWLVGGQRQRDNKHTVAMLAADAEVPLLAAGQGPIDDPAAWLCHWTRPHGGPWPDQHEQDFLMELILGCRTADRSAIAALQRILTTERILGSHVRDRHKAVSLTEVPLHQFRQRRVYRRHRRRYDFEPWGIAVHRQAAQRLGARPVEYLPAEQTDTKQTSWWIHPATDHTGRVDWTEEQEWRVPGDLPLQTCSEHEVVVFVDSSHEQQQIQRWCRWPVVTVP